MNSENMPDNAAQAPHKAGVLEKLNFATNTITIDSLEYQLSPDFMAVLAKPLQRFFDQHEEAAEGAPATDTGTMTREASIEFLSAMIEGTEAAKAVIQQHMGKEGVEGDAAQ